MQSGAGRLGIPGEDAGPLPKMPTAADNFSFYAEARAALR